MIRHGDESLTEHVLVREHGCDAVGDLLRLRDVALIERMLASFVAHVDDADERAAQINRRREEPLARRVVEQLRESRLGGQSVDEERRTPAAAAVDDRIVPIGRRTDHAAKSIFGDEPEEPSGLIDEKERGLRCADIDRAVIKDLLQFWAELLDIRMHGTRL